MVNGARPAERRSDGNGEIFDMLLVNEIILLSELSFRAQRGNLLIRIRMLLRRSLCFVTRNSTQ